MSTPAFEHEVDKAREQVRESHRWSAVIDGYLVSASRSADGLFRLSIAPEHFEGARLGIVDMHPRFLSELDALAEAAPTLFRAVAAGLRAAMGTDDVRSCWDKRHDDFEASVKRETQRLGRRLARVVEKRPTRRRSR